jgi:hypothetical protein
MVGDAERVVRRRVMEPQRVYTTRETLGLLALILTLALGLYWVLPR